MPRIPMGASEATLDVISNSLDELRMIRDNLYQQAQLLKISVYELRLADGSIPILDVNVAVSNLVLAASTLMSTAPRLGR